MRSAFGSLLFGAAFVLAAAVAAPLTQEALRSSSNANPIISRLRDFDVARPVAEGSVFSALAGSVDASIPSTIGYSLSAFGRSFKLQLSKNDALLSPNYQQMRIDFSTPEGKEVSAPQPAALASCYYIGSVENDEESVVAVNLCGGLKGVIKTKDETYNIEPALAPSSSSSASASIFSASPADSTIEHIVFRDSDVRSEEGEDEAAKSHFRCGVHDDGEIADAIREELSHAAATESQPVADEYTIELLAVNDNARYKSKGDGVEQETIQLANIASAYYAKTKFVRPLKMVLVGQVTFLNNDPYTVRQAGSGVEVEGTEGLLWTFVKWIQANKDRLPAHDSGQLLSGLTFTSGIRGLAGVGAMCTTQSGSICQLTSPSPRLNAMIMAHETGHTLSMLHDTMGNSCPMGNVMQPTVSEADSFSSCSIEYTNQFLSKQPGPQCLTNKVNVQSSVVARWDSDAVRMREPAAERRLGKAGEVVKQYWLAFLLGAAFGAAMAASVGIVLHGLARRRADNATKAMGLPTSSSLTSVSQADFYPIARSGTADSFPGHAAAPAGNAV